MTAVVDTQTGEFEPYGREPDARYVVVTVDHNPDPLREKWNGSAIVAKTPQEMAATLDAMKDAEASAIYDPHKALKAVAISNLAARLGKNPGALTPAEIAAERTRVLAIMKAL
jgi:hypothetical protein